MVHNNRNEDEVETDLFQEAGAVIHGGKMRLEKEGVKPAAVDLPEITGSNVGVEGTGCPRTTLPPSPFCSHEPPTQKPKRTSRRK